MTPEHIIINVSDLRMDLRHVLENACFRGRFYVVERSGEPMAVILGLDAYHSLVRAAQAAIDDIPDDLNPAR